MASPTGSPSLLEAREARRRAEQDEQLLANRIALLRQEEAKAWKKIQQTKERAEQVSAPVLLCVSLSSSPVFPLNAALRAPPDSRFLFPLENKEASVKI